MGVGGETKIEVKQRDVKLDTGLTKTICDEDERISIVIANEEPDFVTDQLMYLEFTWIGSLGAKLPKDRNNCTGFYASNYLYVDDTKEKKVETGDGEKGGDVVVVEEKGSSDPVYDFFGATQFEPAWARTAFPCFDDPNRKAVFQLTLGIAQEYDAVSNTEVESVDIGDAEIPLQKDDTDKPAKRKFIKFKPTPKMSTYLLAFVIGKFVFVEGITKDKIKVRAMAMRNQKKEDLQVALDFTIKSLEFYEELFEIPYNICGIGKLDLMCLPFFKGGAMENWGLTTFKPYKILINEKTSYFDKMGALRTNAHEMVHSWIGNLVTLDFWDEVYLNESFARFFEFFAYEKVFPRQKIWDVFQVEVFETALNFELRSISHAMKVKREKLTPCVSTTYKKMFTSISYGKGACVLRHLMDYIGKDKFLRFVRKYLQSNKWGNTRTSHLMKELLAVSTGIPSVKEFFTSYIEKKGFPILSVSLKRNTEKKEVHLVLKQKMFITDFLKPVKSGNENFVFPVRFKCESEDENVFVMKEEEEKIHLKSYSKGWICVNYLQTGYYRVFYDAEMRKLMGEAIYKGEIPFVNRFQILADMIAACRDQKMCSYFDVMELIGFYRKERNLHIVKMITQFFLLALSFFEGQDSIHSYVKKELETFVCDILKDIGYSATEKETNFQTLVRKSAIETLCECHSLKMADSAKKWVENKFFGGKWDALKDPFLAAKCSEMHRLAVYSVMSTEKEFDLLLGKLKGFETPEGDQRLIFFALCFFRQPKLVERIIEVSFVLGEKDELKVLKRFDRVVALLRSCVFNPVLRASVWKKFVENFKEFTSIVNKNFIMYYLGSKCAKSEKDFVFLGKEVKVDPVRLFELRAKGSEKEEWMISNIKSFYEKFGTETKK